MPELPEVETVVRTLNKTIKNKVIKEMNFFYKKILQNTTEQTIKRTLENQKIEKISRKSKFIIFEFNEYVMISHLRMEGKWFYYPNLETIPSKHTEVQIIFEDNTQLMYFDTRKFGTIHLFKQDEYEHVDLIAKLGPEAISKNWTAKNLYDKLQKKKTAVKTVLLDQTIIAGLGNIYVNEVLFECKILPTRPANEISIEECQNIINNSQIILQKAIEYGGTTVKSFQSSEDNKGGYQQFLKVHFNEKKPCKNCGNSVTKMFVNGRGTYICVVCQK
ncbi:formamidopyrimidine-DNA glycosylase [Spiroplasma sp. TIUS-1]|uniref:DNA-formamidopyrimidine glycosylase n=1 Tax=Spiroplasma sp. TIUS-1 TaxID=216963 RepID=UPI0013983E48|nr:DNA-formamidopyrimidine glycosylase [Spiroplasma sp. TIUS-1]QHX36098.1 formamidopyrimidine-DNA glycosylase [Spiroplasma sp. TIUS-1]